MELSPILVAIREDLARLGAAAAGVGALDEQALAELYPLLTAAQDALGELAEALEALQNEARIRDAGERRDEGFLGVVPGLEFERAGSPSIVLSSPIELS